MPTPDPIALPECPPLPAWLVDSCQSKVWAAAWGMLSRHIRTPPIPADMVLVPREATPEMYQAARSVPEPVKPYSPHFSLIWDAMLSASPSTPPLNEPFGNPEELPLNEPFGNPQQLASLEQRARELLNADEEFNAAERELNDETLTSEEKHAASWPRYYAAREKRADALRAITAALSAQSRDADSLLTEAECSVIETLLQLAYAAWCLGDDSEHREGGEVCVPQKSFDELAKHLDALEELPDDQPGYTMGEAAKARWALRRLLNVPPAAPQPREVRGVVAVADDDEDVSAAIRHHLFVYEVDFGAEGKERYVRLADFNKVAAEFELAAPLRREVSP